MRALDLTDQIFGKLRVIERAPKRNDKYTRWICICECGTLTEVRTDYLRNGHTTSCGCEKDIHFSHKVDMTKKYGKLTIDYYDELQGMYICKCDCGNVISVKGYNLNNGNTQSCGCLKSKGELKINQILNEMNICFKTQYSFEDCRFPDTQRLAYFDYAIFDNENNLIGIIEYDGLQHEIGWGNNTESLKQIKAKDKFKEYYCLINNIPLVRIPYNHYNELSKNYLQNILNNLKREK